LITDPLFFAIAVLDRHNFSTSQVLLALMGGWLGVRLAARIGQLLFHRMLYCGRF